MNNFDFNTIEDFDKHIRLSIPHYHFLFDQVKMLVEALAEPETRVMDVGCSTGLLLRSLELDESIYCFGIDQSGLIDPVEGISATMSHEFVKADFFTHPELPLDCSVVISMFFLQFLRQRQRRKALGMFVECLGDGGQMIVCEKTYYDDPHIEHIMTANYLEQKRVKFKDTAILDKNIQLASGMHLLTDTAFIAELSQFGEVSVFFKAFGFIGCLVST